MPITRKKILPYIKTRYVIDGTDISEIQNPPSPDAIARLKDDYIALFTENSVEINHGITGQQRLKNAYILGFISHGFDQDGNKTNHDLFETFCEGLATGGFNYVIQQVSEYPLFPSFPKPKEVDIKNKHKNAARIDIGKGIDSLSADDKKYIKKITEALNDKKIPYVKVNGFPIVNQPGFVSGNFHWGFGPNFATDDIVTIKIDSKEYLMVIERNVTEVNGRKAAIAFKGGMVESEESPLINAYKEALEEFFSVNELVTSTLGKGLLDDDTLKTIYGDDAAFMKDTNNLHIPTEPLKYAETFFSKIDELKSILDQHSDFDSASLGEVESLYSHLNSNWLSEIQAVFYNREGCHGEWVTRVGENRAGDTTSAIAYERTIKVDLDLEPERKVIWSKIIELGLLSGGDDAQRVRFMTKEDLTQALKEGKVSPLHRYSINKVLIEQ